MDSNLEVVSRRIFVLRGRRVMLDRDLAGLYGVRSRHLREQVKRNPGRFPDDFMFQLSVPEAQALVARDAIPSWKSLGGSLPYAFTQEGIAMLSSVLRSPRAVDVNVQIMRAFIRMRESLRGNRVLRAKLDALERKYDAQFRIVFDAIRDLLEAPEAPGKRIGFNS